MAENEETDATEETTETPGGPAEDAVTQPNEQDVIIKKLRDEAAKARQKARDLKTQNEALSTKAEAGDALQAEVDDMRHQLTMERRKVALASKGLPAEIVGSVEGDTEDEIAASVDKLAGLFATRTPGALVGGLENKTPSARKTSPRDYYKTMRGL